MHKNQVYNFIQDKDLDRYFKHFKNPVFRGEEYVYALDSAKTAKENKKLSQDEKTLLYHNVYMEANQEIEELKRKFDDAVKDQTEGVDKNYLNRLYDFLKEMPQVPNVDKPFENIPYLDNTESERRKVLQRQAYSIYRDKELEADLCHEIAGHFRPFKTNERGLQLLFSPKTQGDENDFKNVIEMANLSNDVIEITNLLQRQAKENVQLLTEEQQKYVDDGSYEADRKKVAGFFEGKITEALNAGIEIASAKTDEEFLEVVSRNYWAINILAETGLAKYQSYLNFLCIEEKHLSPEFLSFYKANAELGVAIGADGSRI
ncbi:MAG: hypothetical protein MJ072_03740 [Clostridia bacterium]|nr:hypothetical protein [Clostridia bacterium]